MKNYYKKEQQIKDKINKAISKTNKDISNLRLGVLVFIKEYNNFGFSINGGLNSGLGKEEDYKREITLFENNLKEENLNVIQTTYEIDEDDDVFYLEYKIEE